MGPKRIRLVKRDQVDVTGSIQVGPAGVAAQSLLQTAAVPSSLLNARLQEARVIESNPEYAILEVVCGCGCKSQIQCHYVNN